MDINKILKADYLDILYDGRNKAYGSYELRRKYKKRATLAGIIAFSIVGALFALLMIPPSEKKVEEAPPLVIKDVQLMQPPPLDEKAPPPPPPPSTPPPPLKSMEKFTPPVIKKNEEVKEADKPAPTMPDANTVVGPASIKGSDNPDAIDPNLSNVAGDGRGQAVVDAAPPKEQIYRNVEQMPEFDGDINKWLRSQIRYPAAASAQGIQGRVYLEFVLEKNGTVTDVKVLRDIGGGCGEEAKRVVSKLKFKKPAMQNGHPVRMLYNLSVAFTLQ